MPQTATRADPKTHATPGLTLKVYPANMIVRAVISTDTPDRVGDIIVPSGLRNADEFLRNPVVLWAHQRALPPIGTCERLTIEPDRIIAETKFAPSSAFANDVFTLLADCAVCSSDAPVTNDHSINADAACGDIKNARAVVPTDLSK